MRRPTIVRKSGPYTCESRADGTILISPDWPQFPKWTEEEGGGPGILSRLSLGIALTEWLNSPYVEVAD